MTNMYVKSEGVYKDLPLGSALLTPDILSFADFVESALYTMTQLYPMNDRIDITIDSGMIAKYDGIPCDTFNVTLYRNGYELEKCYTSNYHFTEVENFRCFWVDLYYSKENYDSDKVFKDIIREINNFKNRDFKEYLDTL